jgi:general stress protein 26
MDKEVVKNEVRAFLDDDWTLYVLTDQNSRKIQNLRKNQHIAFVSGTIPQPHTVQIQGTAELIEANNSAYGAFQQKMVESKRLENDPMYNMFGNNYLILKIKIEWLRWLYFDEASGDPKYVELVP